MLHSVQQFQRNSRKYISQSETRAAIVFPIGPIKTTCYWNLASCQVSFNSIQRLLRRIRNVSANQRPRQPPSYFSDWPNKNTNLVEDIDILLSVKLRWILFSGFRKKSLKCEKVTETDGRQTTRNHNSTLQPSAQVHSKSRNDSSVSNNLTYVYFLYGDDRFETKNDVSTEMEIFRTEG